MNASGANAAGGDEKFSVAIVNAVENRSKRTGFIRKSGCSAIQDVTKAGDRHKEQSCQKEMLPEQDAGDKCRNNTGKGQEIRCKIQLGAGFSEKQGFFFIRLSGPRFHLATSRLTLLKTGAQKAALPSSTLFADIV